MRKLTKEKAEQIWDILVRHAGASKDEYDKSDFIYNHINLTESFSEWRFCGLLGFGGKFKTSGDRWYVSFYSEDSTPERVKIVGKINSLLEDI